MSLRFILGLVCLMFTSYVTGQIDVEHYENKFEKGEITLKKSIDVSFFKDDKDERYKARVSHHYEKLFVDTHHSGLIQVPFNQYQEVNLKRARYFKLDSLGKKTLLENVKVKYADVKDYFIRNIFYNDLKVKQFQSEVDLPQNYLINYSYEVVYNDLKFLTSFYFQEPDEVVEQCEINIRKSPEVDMAVFDFNFTDDLVKEEDEESIKYTSKGLNRFKSTPNQTGGSYYLPHIILNVKSYQLYGKTQKVFEQTEDLYAWYASLIKELNPDFTYLESLNQQILSSQTMSDEEKITAIFSWVKANVQYIAFEDGIAGFKPEEAHEVGKLKYGDCKGIANLLVNLLRSAGFDAHHAWIGTRQKNYDYSMPSLVVDNHMICALNYKDKIYYLDGTSKSANWEIPPAFLMGKEVLVENGEGFLIKDIPISSSEDNVVSFVGKTNKNSHYQEYTFQVELTGYFILDIKNYLNYSKAKYRESVLFYFVEDYLTEYSIIDIDNINISDEKISFSLSAKKHNGIIQDKNSNLFFSFIDSENLIQLSKNAVPFYIDFPHKLIIDLTMENFSCSQNCMLEKQIGTSQYNALFQVGKNQNNLNVKQTIVFNLLDSKNVDLNAWNEFVLEAKSFANYPIYYENH